MRILQVGLMSQPQINPQSTGKLQSRTRLRDFHQRFLSGNDGGFSMMEIMLVLVIISVLTTISLPALRGFAASRRLKTSAQAIVDTLTFARSIAITERTTHLVVFDLTGNRYWLTSSETFDVQNPIASVGRTTNVTPVQGQPAVISRTSGIMGIPKSLSEGISISSMVTNNNGTMQQVITGDAFIYFTPTSTSENTIMYLQNLRENVVAITVEGVTGRASIQELSAEQIQAADLRN